MFVVYLLKSSNVGVNKIRVVHLLTHSNVFHKSAYLSLILDIWSVFGGVVKTEWYLLFIDELRCSSSSSSSYHLLLPPADSLCSLPPLRLSPPALRSSCSRLSGTRWWLSDRLKPTRRCHIRYLEFTLRESENPPNDKMVRKNHLFFFFRIKCRFVISSSSLRC